VDLSPLGEPSLGDVEHIVAVLDVYLDSFVASLVIRP
jgi:hypothetical protein